MTALYVFLGVLVGGLAAGAALWGYFSRRSNAILGAALEAGRAAADSEAGRVAVETQRNADLAADYEVARIEAGNVQEPSVALARWRSALLRLRRPRS